MSGLRPPPSGFGSWDGETKQEVKDRWVFPLRPDPEREAVLRLRDESLRQRFEWVIVDSPPLASVTDAQLLSRQVDASLLAFREDV